MLGLGDELTTEGPPRRRYNCLILTDADHHGRVDLERVVLVRVALDPEVGAEVALADLVEVFAGESLENLQHSTTRTRDGFCTIASHRRAEEH